MAETTISGNAAAWNSYQAAQRHIDRLQDPADRWAAWERLKWHVEQQLDRTKVFAPQNDLLITGVHDGAAESAALIGIVHFESNPGSEPDLQLKALLGI